MQRRHLLFAALALASAMRADVGLDGSMLYARQVSAMLGPTLWNRVICIHNSAAESRYPRLLGAVVFEMGGILWFYTATDGTQSLSVRRGHVLEDKLDFRPLLTQIDPGFTGWDRDSGKTGSYPKGSVPPNACFIQSIVLLRNNLSAGVGAEHMRLLSYYVAFPTGLKGHTVLYIETNKEPTVIDPLKDRRPMRVRSPNPEDAQSVAYCIRRDVALARWVPVGLDDFVGNLREDGHLADN
jgi:hypothetical protein